jgi:hypothetical protein
VYCRNIGDLSRCERCERETEGRWECVAGTVRKRERESSRDVERSEGERVVPPGGERIYAWVGG